MLIQTISEVPRQFDYDYIFIDAICLVIWLFILLCNKKHTPLKAGFMTAIIVFIIDAVIWWNLPSKDGITGYVREYSIGGVQIPHPTREFFWSKFGADFMMTISYSLFAFSWLWIMFESWKTKNTKDMLMYTNLFFWLWMAIPWISKIVDWDNRQVEPIRHMQSQIILQIVVVIIGYLLLFVLYSTEKFGIKDLKGIGYVFFLGCFQAFAMEIPLFLSGIRPADTTLLLYEIIVLTNQGVPYLYIIFDKIIPYIGKKREWPKYQNWV